MIRESRGRTTSQPPPSVQEVHRIIARTKASLDAIEEGYRWLHSTAYVSAGGTSEVHVSIGESNPTANTAVAARTGQLRQTAQLIQDFRTVAGALERSLRGRPEIVERPDEFPQVIPPDELDGLREAKARRESRGEGWGRG